MAGVSSARRDRVDMAPAPKSRVVQSLDSLSANLECVIPLQWGSQDVKLRARGIKLGQVDAVGTLALVLERAQPANQKLPTLLIHILSESEDLKIGIFQFEGERACRGLFGARAGQGARFPRG